MLSNFSSMNIVNKQYLNEEIDIYKDTLQAMLKIKKDINQLKKINNNFKNSESDMIDFEDHLTINHLKNSFEESLILLNIMKRELEKNILKKYDIENIKQDYDYDENNYKNVININNFNNNINDNQDVQETFIKKNFKSI